MIDKILYLFSDGIRSLLRNKITTFATIIAIGITSSFVMITAQLGENISKFVQVIRDQYEFQIFFDESINEDEANEINLIINSFNNIKSTRLISKVEAAKIFNNEFGENIFEILDYNPLPFASVIEISAPRDNSLDINFLSKKIKKIKGVDEIRFQSKLVSFIERYYELSFIFITLLSSAILFATVIIISNTIRLTIFARRDLIRILKLVGATNNFIKFPFILEGIIEGIFGSLIASLISYLTFQAINYFLLIFSEHVLIWSFGLNFLLVLTIIFFSLIGSIRSVKKFL